MSRSRQDPDAYYLGLARMVASRSTCLRRNHGAVLVRDSAIVSTGYNGPARGMKHCDVCYREQLGLASGERYEVCPAVHAEVNAIINAARTGAVTKDSTLYITGTPCMMCARAIVNAGVYDVYAPTIPDDEWSQARVDGLDILQVAKIPVYLRDVEGYIKRYHNPDLDDYTGVDHR